MSIAVVNRTRWFAWHAFQPKTRARKVFLTPELPISRRLVPLSKEHQIQQPENTVLRLHAALVMEEVKTIDAGLTQADVAEYGRPTDANS
jgi:hypothetical protein